MPRLRRPRRQGLPDRRSRHRARRKPRSQGAPRRWHHAPRSSAMPPTAPRTWSSVWRRPASRSTPRSSPLAAARASTPKTLCVARALPLHPPQGGAQVRPPHETQARRPASANARPGPGESRLRDAGGRRQPAKTGDTAHTVEPGKLDMDSLTSGLSRPAARSLAKAPRRRTAAARRRGHRGRLIGLWPPSLVTPGTAAAVTAPRRVGRAGRGGRGARRARQRRRLHAPVPGRDGREPAGLAGRAAAPVTGARRRSAPRSRDTPWRAADRVRPTSRRPRSGARR